MIIATIIASLLLIASVGCIIIIIAPKLRLLSAINVDVLSIEQHERTKNKIIYQRMRRRFYEFASFLGFAFKPISDFFAQFFTSLSQAYGRLVDSREYKRRQWFNTQQTNVEIHDNQGVDERIAKYIEQAKELHDNQQYDQAESKYIDALSLDANCLDPYRGLARLYASQKDWRKCIEVLHFLMKLYRERFKSESGKDDTRCALDCADDASLLTEIYCALEDYEKAAQSIRKAVRLQPLNPKYLDQSLEIAILLNQKLKAEKLLDVLRKANPDNNKIDEFEKRINELSYS